MNVLMINTAEKVGGAAIAANRLMEALKADGVKVKMLVRDRQTGQMSVSSVKQSWKLPVKFLWERLVVFFNNRFSRRNLFIVDLGNAGVDISDSFEVQQADIIHLHWCNQGFLSLETIDRLLHLGKPVVVTMHNMWYFTAVCQYSGDCSMYETGCSRCPILNGGWPFFDLTRRVYETKARIYGDANMTFVGCSRWITKLAGRSLLTKGHRVVSIPNPIDMDVYKPLGEEGKRRAREQWNLPTDKHLLLFGSQKITEERKGFRYLLEACHIIHSRYPDYAGKVGIVVVGSNSRKIRQLPRAENLLSDIYTVDYITNEHDMVALFNAVDLYVTPTLQDNLPNTIVESLSCGTPCVGFGIGGVVEMIDHQVNGYVAEYRNAGDLADGIIWCLDSGRYPQLCDRALEKARSTYSEKNVSRQYIELYEQLIN